MGKCCQFFWVTVLDLVVGLPSRRSPLLRVCFVMSFLCYILAFSVLLKLGLVRKLVLILFRLCFFVIQWVVLFCLVSWFKIMVFCHLKLSWNRTCRLTGHLDFLFWLVCSLVGLSSRPSASPPSSSSFVALLRGLRSGTGARVLLSFLFSLSTT